MCARTNELFAIAILNLQTAIPWLHVVPWGIEKVLMWIKLRYNNPPVFITENGKFSLPGVEFSVGLVIPFFYTVRVFTVSIS